MKLNEFLDWLDSVRPSAYTAEQKTVWVNDLESSLWTEVFLQPMSLWKARRSEQGDAPLLLDESWRSLYAWYIWAMMDFASGEHSQYANAMAMYNQKLSQLQCWYAEEHEPSLRNARWTDWSAAAYTGAAESIPVYTLRPGWAVLGAECRVTAPFEDGETVITIGTEEAPDGLMAACQLVPTRTGLYRSLRFLAGDDGARVIFVSGGNAGEVRVRLLLQPPAGCYMPPLTAPASNITVIQGSGSGTGADGQDGADGVSCTHEWNGTVLTVTSASGTSSADLKGDPGEAGPQGETGAAGPYYVPGVDESGNLSWSLKDADDAVVIPLPVNIKGPKGETGATGPQGEKGEKGDKGDPGDSASGGVLLWANASPTSSFAAQRVTLADECVNCNRFDFYFNSDLDAGYGNNTFTLYLADGETSAYGWANLTCYWGSWKNYQRAFDINLTGDNAKTASFGAGYATGSEDAATQVPLKIIGYKV